MREDIRSPADSEIDLAQLILGIWQGKWIIVGITVFCMLAGFLYISVKPQVFTVEFDLRPITSIQFNEYDELNSLGFFDVSIDGLLTSFVEEFQSRDELVKAFRDVGLLNKDDFAADTDYETALLRKAFELKIVFPELNTAVGNVSTNNKFMIKFSDQNIEKYLSGVGLALIETEKKYQESLQFQFNQKLDLFEQKNAYKIEDIDRKMLLARTNYDKVTFNHLAYLQEQAQIARVLGIAKNTIESQSFGAGTSMIAGLQTDSPFYLRGYESIEKEMSLLPERLTKDAFIPELVELEVAKIAIEQDPTIQRALAAFNSSPITSDRFKAALHNLDATIPVAKLGNTKILVLAVFLGLMLGLIVVGIRNSVLSSTKTT